MTTPQVTVTANKFDPNTQTYSPSVPANTSANNVSNTAVPTKTPNMNASNISPATPIPVASPYVDPNTYTGKINQVATDLGTTVNSYQAKVDQANADAKNQALDIANLQSLMGGKSADTQKIYGEQGVTAAYNQLVDLNAQATGLKNEAAAIPIQIQKEFAGTGATEAGAGAIQTSRLRDNALKSLSLGQQAAIASAQYDKAKNYADMIVDSKYAQMEADIKAKQTNLAALKDYTLTPAQEELKIAKEKQYNLELQQIQDKKDLEKNINSIVLEATKNGASPTVISAIQKSGSMGDAIKNAGSALASPNTEVIKLGDSTAYLIDKSTGKVIKSFGAGGGGNTNAGNGYSITTNSNGSVNITGTTAETQAYANVLNTVLGSSKLTKDQKADFINSVKNGEDPMTVFRNKAKDILGQTEGTKITNYEVARDTLKSIQAQLAEYYANGGQTNVFKGNIEKTINSLGQVKDPKLVELGTQIQSSLQIYRNAVSGTAYSVQEGQDIASIFPGIDKSTGLNNSILAGRLKAFDSTIDASYESALGKTGYTALKELEAKKNAPTPKGIMTDRDFVETSLVKAKIKYDDLVNNTPQGQIPVIDNATGQSGYIPYKDFDPIKYTKA